MASAASTTKSKASPAATRFAASTPPTDSTATACPERCCQACASSLSNWRVAMDEIPLSGFMGGILVAAAAGSKQSAPLAAMPLRHNPSPGIHAMDLKQLEYFVRVAELGSFTRAAIELDVAQPALSRQVRLLEVELRQNLLVRNGRGAVPTEAGKLLLDHGRGILHQVERAREDLGRLRGGLAGRVAVGLPSSVARVLTVPLTRSFREQLPEARLSISEGLSSGLQEGLVGGRLDIAVLYNAQPSREVDVTPLLEEDLLLVQARPPGLHEDPPPGPVPLEEVARLPLVIPTRPNAIRMH